MVNEVEVKAVKVALKYLKSKGYTVDPVEHKGIGFDIRAKKNGKYTKVEVKGSKKSEGIPDCYISEFKKRNGRWEFIPDILLIVRFNKNLKILSKECLTKKEINQNQYNHLLTKHIRLSHSLKTDLKRRKIGMLI